MSRSDQTWCCPRCQSQPWELDPVFLVLLLVVLLEKNHSPPSATQPGRVEHVRENVRRVEKSIRCTNWYKVDASSCCSDGSCVGSVGSSQMNNGWANQKTKTRSANKDVAWYIEGRQEGLAPISQVDERLLLLEIFAFCFDGAL